MIINNGFVDLFFKTTSEAAYASSLLKGKGDKTAATELDPFTPYFVAACVQLYSCRRVARCDTF